MDRPRGSTRSARISWGRVAALVVVALGVGYAPIAATELWPYAHPGAPAVGESLLAHLTSPRYVAEAFATRIKPYDHSLAALIVHSVLGGLLMLLGPLQLLTAVRRRARLHRALGVVFAVTVYVSMAGAAVYLLRTAPRDAFSGPAFWIVLATILVGTVFSVTFGIVAAVQRMPQIHQRWMLLCYGFLMTAPLLRLEWGALPVLLPGLSMAQINQIAVMHLGSVVAFGALIASRRLDRRTELPGMNGSWVPWWALLAAGLAGAAALGWITEAFLSGGGAQNHRLLLGYLLPFAATAAVMAWRMRRAANEGRTWAREEWRIHLVALSLAPVFSALCVLPFERAFDLDRVTALSAAVAIGCGVLAFWATALTGLRALVARETAKRTSAAPVAPTEAAPVR
ncbi:DUF2306 domain-containing protein [Streptacidiphilus anmyonensis]|uniref:DUF2306 domain-containing protein n=1 Tax=Streptacidiphilus anmyonensis TaxID=405782 RepID=UPI0005AB186D|nr:DUF2306 domain-containing protein [Streptacidiphilus anmyonensis]